eukprot:327929-Rhodomonas_salina.2
MVNKVEEGFVAHSEIVTEILVVKPEWIADPSQHNSVRTTRLHSNAVLAFLKKIVKLSSSSLSSSSEDWLSLEYPVNITGRKSAACKKSSPNLKFASCLHLQVLLIPMSLTGWKATSANFRSTATLVLRCGDDG